MWYDLRLGLVFQFIDYKWKQKSRTSPLKWFIGSCSFPSSYCGMNITRQLQVCKCQSLFIIREPVILPVTGEWVSGTVRTQQSANNCGILVILELALHRQTFIAVRGRTSTRVPGIHAYKCTQFPGERYAVASHRYDSIYVLVPSTRYSSG